MLPDLRLLIPATVATFFLAAGAGLFASVRIAQDSLVAQTDNRATGDESPITRISMNWPMPGANRALALRELSEIVKETALAPLVPPAQAAFTPPAAAAEAGPAASAAEAAPVPGQAALVTPNEKAAAAPEVVSAPVSPAPVPDKVPAIMASLPGPTSASDGRPDLPPLADDFKERSTETPAENVTLPSEPADPQPDDSTATPPQTPPESVTLLSEPASTHPNEPKELETTKSDPEISDIPVERESTGTIPQDMAPSVQLPDTPPLPRIASRPSEPEDVSESRDVPEVVVTKPRRTSRARRSAQVQSEQSKQQVQPAPDINALEPHERYSKSPANIFYTAPN